MKRNEQSSFARSESGAVTVDWVILTAVLCALAVIIVTSVSDVSASRAADAVSIDVLK
ncbi:hypothetical protein ACQ5SP_09620 [Rhodovulum sp. YNF3179]|mgnify:CR=1 FL=1|uniref:hypothetical protein n=1 Tax=Rhodovulum sp. YNF3179 TaxID=3425127 RepID=UPI003D349093